MMINNKNIAKILSACIIASSIITTNVSAADLQKGNDKLTSSQKAQMEREIKELPLKYNKLQEKINNQKNSIQDKKNSAVSTSQTLVTPPDGPLESTGTYPTRKGVILVTTDNTTLGIEHGHAGILWSSTSTVESVTSGVCRMPNTWNNYYDTVYGITVSGTTATEDSEAADWCNSQVGKPYNYLFTDTSTRSRFYCSHLVWASYKDLHGINLDDDGDIIWPVDLVNSSNTYIVYTK